MRRVRSDARLRSVGVQPTLGNMFKLCQHPLPTKLYYPFATMSGKISWSTSRGIHGKSRDLFIVDACIFMLKLKEGQQFARTWITDRTWAASLLKTISQQPQHYHTAHLPDCQTTKFTREQFYLSLMPHGITVLQNHTSPNIKHHENAAHRPLREEHSPARAHSSPAYKRPTPRPLFSKQHQTANSPQESPLLIISWVHP